MITMSCSIDKKALLLVVFLCKENQSFFFKNLEKTENTLFCVHNEAQFLLRIIHLKPKHIFHFLKRFDFEKKTHQKSSFVIFFCQKLIKKNKAFQCHVFPTSKSEEKRYNVMYIFYFRYRVLNVFNLNFVPSNVLLFSKKL